MKITSTSIARELKRSGITQQFDHWYLNTGMKKENLNRFLDKHLPELDKDSEVFTSELLNMQDVWHDFIERERVADLASQADELGQDLTKDQKWVLWLGQPFLEQGKLYNTYTKWENGEPTFRHRKKFLWHEEGALSDSDIFHIERWLTKWTPISTEEYDGFDDNKAILICYEVSKFFNEVYQDRPTRIPEIRKEKPDFVIAPSWWTKNRDVLLRSMRSISRRNRDHRLDFMAVRKQGCIAAVINHDDAYVIGPYENGRVKAATYARVREPGYVHLMNDGFTTGTL